MCAVKEAFEMWGKFNVYVKKVPGDDEKFKNKFKSI